MCGNIDRAPYSIQTIDSLTLQLKDEDMLSGWSTSNLIHGELFLVSD